MHYPTLALIICFAWFLTHSTALCCFWWKRKTLVKIDIIACFVFSEIYKKFYFQNPLFQPVATRCRRSRIPMETTDALHMSPSSSSGSPAPPCQELNMYVCEIGFFSFWAVQKSFFFLFFMELRKLRFFATWISECELLLLQHGVSLWFAVIDLFPLRVSIISACVFSSPVPSVKVSSEDSNESELKPLEKASVERPTILTVSGFLKC